MRLQTPGDAVTSKRPEPRGTGPSGCCFDALPAPAVVPGSEFTLIEGGSLELAVVGSGVAEGGARLLTFEGPAGLASALAGKPLFEPRDFQPKPTPAPSAITPSATAPITSQALLRGFGVETVIDAYDVFGVCHEGPVGPDEGYGGMLPAPGGTLPESESGWPGVGSEGGIAP